MADILRTVFLDAEFASLDQGTRVRFPVQGARATGGHDSAKHVAYRRDGADFEPTGLKAYEGTLTVPLLDVPALNRRYGTMVPGVRTALIEAFEANPIGRLTHPFRGVLLVMLGDWTETMDPENRSGTIMEVTWMKQDPAGGDFISESRLPDAARDAPTAGAAADTAVDALPAGRPTGYTAMGPAVTSALLTLGVAPSVTAVLTTFRDLHASVDANVALPALLAVAGAPALLAHERLRAALYVARAALFPGLGDARTYVVPRAAPVWQIAQDVYGNASLTSLIFAANAVRDPSVIPAGTVLTILPQS